MINIRDSRFGPALVVETRPSGGSYVLGFRIDPPNRLRAVAKHLTAMYDINLANPEFGVEYSTTEYAVLSETEPVPAVEVEEIDDEDEAGVMSAYYKEGGEEGTRPPLYSEELGLAIETLAEGQTLSSLWQVVPNPVKG